MRVKHHYYYEAKAYLISFLEKNKISYKVSDLPESKNKLCTFDLYEDQEAYRNFRNQFFFLSKNDSMIRVSKGTPMRTLKISYKTTNSCQEMV